MTFTPTFSAVFEEGILDGVLALLTRDFKNALDFFHPTEDYPDFAEKGIGQVLGNEFPGLSINPAVQIEESDDGIRLIETIVMEMRLAVVDDNGPEAVTRKLMRYIRAADAVFRTEVKQRNQALYLQSFDQTKVGGLEVSVDHAYGPIGSNGTTLMRVAQVNLTIKLMEIAG